MHILYDKCLHEVGSVLVDERTEGHAVLEGRGHVVDRHVRVAAALRLAPLLQSLDRRHAALFSNGASTTTREKIARIIHGPRRDLARKSITRRPQVPESL